MVIRLDENYNAMTSTALLGYVGETNARPVSVKGMEVDGADRYVLTIDYGDGTAYEVDITGGQWTPTADILRSAQTVSCQIAAKKLSGDEYILVKKSRIFRLRIGAAIGDTAIPSPSVAADALDRIDAIGRQTHADMQTAVTAAETATTMANNAAKSATAAEKSADTATQAASRAEAAQASAETSAAQSETARQGAENARQQAVKSQNDAKVSAAQASTAAQQTEADKTITAGYAKTAKTNADSTAADRQAVQTLAEQVTTDKATVADHAAQVATDRKAAETAAQTAQAVADSLPEDYVTAVSKIAENTAEIGHIKLTDKELTRRVNALYDMGNGITHQFETDTDTAYTKTVPTGAKLMSVKSIGGHSEVIDGEIVSAWVTEVAVGDTAHQIPEAIRNLPGYGWSAGTARNYVDYENKKYVQCVDSVDLGSLTWRYSKMPFGWGDNQWFSAPIQSIKVIPTNTQLANVLCKKYTTRCAYVADGNDFFRVDKSIGQHQGVARVTVLDTACTDAAAFKQAMQGVILYYELESPIVTDISDLLTEDFLRNVEVEAGGSVTFKNSNDNYHIPVPSEEEYIVKLSEVGGTT
jgi:hypothetical protein